jgi:HK97 gp10 family phage protein
MIRTRTVIDNSDRIFADLHHGVEREEIQAGDQTASMARELCPKRTGRLASTIESQGGTVECGGDDAPYAEHVHNGTHKMAARPFMVQAFEFNRDDFEKALEALIK